MNSLIEELTRARSELLQQMNSYINENYKDEDVHEEYEFGGYIGDPRGCMNEGEVTGFDRALGIVRRFFERHGAE